MALSIININDKELLISLSIKIEDVIDWNDDFSDFIDNFT